MEMIVIIYAEKKIKRRYLLTHIYVSSISILFLMSSPVLAQNLVPNHGFEKFIQCPPYPGQIHLSEAWDSPNNNTTDFFHRCSPVGDGASVPDNLFGTQEPYGGNGYVGIRAWIPAGQNPIYREYLSVKLLEPLQAGQPYFISLQVSPADLSTHLSDGIGVYFSKDSLLNKRLYNIRPHIRHPEGEIVGDFEKWVEISDTYIAEGGESYLIIGNFEDDKNTLKQPVASNSDKSDMIYYYIDEMVVEACSSVSDAISLGIDTTLCQGEVLEVLFENEQASFTWPDGRISSNYAISRSGSYVVKIAHDKCVYTDTVNVDYTFFELPLEEITLCEEESWEIELPYEEIEVNGDLNPAGSVVTVGDEGLFVVSVEENGCKMTDTLIVISEKVPSDITRVIDTSFCKGDTIRLNTPEGVVWLDNQPVGVMTIQDTGTYEASIRHTCYDEELYYRVNALDCTCEINGSNVLSPNGDGVNEVWKLESNSEIKDGSVHIFDRWGREVFEGRVQEGFWNGCNKGVRCRPGIYFWQAEYSCAESGRRLAQGYIWVMY